MSKTKREEKIAHEKLAIEITADYLKEEKDTKIKKKRHLTRDGDDPPDFYFKIGDDKIACEVRHFTLINQPGWEKGSKLAKEVDAKDKIEKEVQRGLNEKGIPPLDCYMGFVKPPTKSQEAPKIVNIITMMHNESITDGNEYKRNDPKKYYELFIKNNISRIDIVYIDPLDRANIDEKHLLMTSRGGFCKTIEVEEMQAVIDKKDKDIRNYKEDCDQKWLIITDYITMGFFRLGGAAKEAQYKCNFDAVLYIEIGNRKQQWTGSRTDTFTVYELKVELKQGGY